MEGWHNRRPITLAKISNVLTLVNTRGNLLKLACHYFLELVHQEKKLCLHELFFHSDGYLK